MEKIYFINKYSTEEACFHEKNTRFFRRFLIFSLFTYLLLFSSKLFSQGNNNIGLENIFISDGATIIEKKNNNHIETTTYNEVKLENLKINNFNKKQIITKAKLQKKRIVTEKKKRIIKTAANNQPVFVFNKKTSSRNSFHNSNAPLEQLNNNHNQYGSKFIGIDIEWTSYLFVFEVKQLVLFQIYYNNKLKENLFTRPPPLI